MNKTRSNCFCLVALLVCGSAVAQSSRPDTRQISDPKTITSASNPNARPIPIDDLYFTLRERMQQTPPAAATPAAPVQMVASQQTPAQKITKYTLPPDRYQKARNLGKIQFRFGLISFVYGLVVLWFVLRGKFAAKYRTWAENKSSKRFVQALIFSPLLILTIDVLGLPT